MAITFLSCKKTNDKETEVTNDKEQVVTTKNTVTFTEEQTKVAGIKTGTLQKEKISEEIFCTGKVEALPQNRAKVSVPSAAFIDKIFVKHGVFVKKGQPILTFQNNEFIDLEASYLKLKNELEFKKQEYERQKKLYEENAVSEKKFKQVELDYNIALTEKKALEQKLLLLGVDIKSLTPEKISSSVILRAPFAGYIDEMYITTGQYVEPTVVLFEIINPTGYDVMLNVYAKYRDAIKIGDEVQFRPCDNCDFMNAKIYSIGHLIDDETKTFRVHATPEKVNSDKLVAGAYINAKILVNDFEVAALPKNALIPNQDESYVFVKVDDNTYELVKIEVGRTNNGLIEIKNPEVLQDKEIVIEGANYLYAKMNE